MRGLCIAALFLALGAMGGSLSAQESPSGQQESRAPYDWTESPVKPEVAGLVRYPGNKEVPNPVLVRLETTTGAMLRQTWTGTVGEFSFPEIACGNYVLAVDAAGFKPIRVPVEQSYIPMGTIFLYLVPGNSESTAVEGAALSSRELQIPENARKEYSRGLEALSKRKLDESVSHFRRAIQTYPSYSDAYIQLGWTQLQRRAYQEAEQALEKVLRLNEKDAAAHALLGSVRRQENRLPEAVQEYERSLSLEAASWRAHLELGETLLKLGRVDQAYAHVLRAHQLNASSAGVHLQLYNTLIMRNDYQAAVAELDEILKLFPQHPMAPRARQQRDALRAKLALARR